MNNIWSKYVQGTRTLYYTRRLRFDDQFSHQYKRLFLLPEDRPLNILEIGCGPGVLAGAIKRWYPNATVTGIDRDTEFISFAKKHYPDIEFIEGDATSLPFGDSTFDAVISNTVAEHIEPTSFYSEQARVLKEDGICLVLSARRGINSEASCITYSDFELDFFKKVQENDDSCKRFSVCQYPMNESEMPLEMSKHGFSGISTGYAIIDLTPDNPRFSKDFAIDMINAQRYTSLDGIEAVLSTMPDLFSTDSVEEMKRLANLRYDARIEAYNKGEKHWDTSVSVTMILRGIKKHCL